MKQKLIEACEKIEAEYRGVGHVTSYNCSMCLVVNTDCSKCVLNEKGSINKSAPCTHNLTYPINSEFSEEVGITTDKFYGFGFKSECRADFYAKLKLLINDTYEDDLKTKEFRKKVSKLDEAIYEQYLPELFIW